MIRLGEHMRIGRLSAGLPRRLLNGWSRLPSTVTRLVLVPVDLTSAEPGFLDEIARGTFCLGQHTIDTGADSPFSVTGAPDDWLAELHGFSWLSHLRKDASEAAIACARRLVGDWLAREARARGVVWRSNVLATRITSWLVNAGLLLEGADPTFYRAVLKSLGRQIRRLDAERHATGEGVQRLHCLSTLLQAALAIGAAEHHLERLEDELGAEIEAQILADGCHVSRNPSHTLDVLAWLLPLRRCCQAIRRPCPVIDDTVRRMIFFLRVMRLGDGTLGRFNGVGQPRRDLLGMLLAFDPEEGSPLHMARAGGYVRLESRGTIVLIDAGRAPPTAHATAAQAGCLAFEISSGKHGILRNGGAPGTASGVEGYLHRATSNHNTLVLDARSSARLAEAPAIERRTGAKPIRGPARVSASVEERDGSLVFVGEHDGYVEETGIVHHRSLRLSMDGRRLAGLDRLAGPAGVMRLPVDLPFAIHFHLADAISAEIEAGATSAVLTTRDGEARWRLAASDARMTIEAATDWGHVTGPISSRQLVLRASTPGESTVAWVLEEVGASEAN